MDPESKQGPDGTKRNLHRKRKLVLVELCQDFAKNTSLHGLQYITERGLNRIEKLFWIITFLISISLCIVLIQNVWVKWQTSPVIVALSEHLVPVWEVPFPSVTICPQTKAKSSVYNFSKEASKIYMAMKADLKDDDMDTIRKFEDIGLICWLDRLLLYPVRNHSDAEIIKNMFEVSPDISDTFSGCWWHQDSIDCEELFTPVLTREGVCFNMNSLASSEIFQEENIQKNYSYLNSSTPSKGWSDAGGYSSDGSDVYPRRGRGNGAKPDLRIILLEKTVNRDGLCNGVNRGFKVYLQHPGDMPQSSLYYYAALPKQASSFALKISILNTSSTLRNYSPETRHRQCYFPEERELRYFLTYTTNNCRLECLSNYTFETCGCVWFHMPHDDSSTICREGKRTCVEKALERYGSDEGHANSKIGRCQCLPTCVGIQYDAEVLKTKFEAHGYIHAIGRLLFDFFSTGNNSREADAGYEFSQIEMYYKEPRFVSMRRSELFGLTDFLANCGGLLGLFLGFSFLSLVEIFYFLTLRLGCTLRKNMQPAQTDEKQN